MKKLVVKCGKAAADLALAITRSNVNSTCMFAMYQPKLPKGSDKLKKS